ncbi:universal stress protein [Rubrobacter tropicus]|uniref:universal stress protein n=1 Tax=Rubrobacter tropicus TaxID=2653851 RepID=UPI00140B6764|nr:universal stress protein [Rubrobacter tropicus]
MTETGYFPAKILLATDGSEDASAATRAAVDLAKRSGSELHVVHAFEFIPPREYMSVALRLRTAQGASARGQELLDEQVERIERYGVKVAGAQVRAGSPVDQILSAAEEIGAGLVVIGRRGLGGVRRLLMGSVSEGVIHNARCPVLVLRGEEGAWPPSYVIMADDSSADSRSAARLAATMGGLLGVEGMLVQIYPRLLKTSRDAGPLQASMVDHALLGAEAELNVLADELERLLGRRPGVKLVPDEGADGIDGIALTLMDEAQEAGGTALISVGSRGVGGIQRARVGSVSTKVVRAADGPVLIYPQTPERPTIQEEAALEESSFWSKLFDDRYRSGRQERVISYIAHRLGDGANLKEVTQEEYVRRLASSTEVDEILRNPKLVEAARRKMQEGFEEAGKDLGSV